MGGGYQNVVKFFVINLPEGCTPWELRQGLEGFGVISGTYVAKKRDKMGNRFGFVSFVEVKDRLVLEKSLSGAKLGNSKLKINLAKFALENSGLADQQEDKKNGQSFPSQVDKGRSFKIRDGRSFRDVLWKSKATEEVIMASEGSKGVGVPDSGKSVIVPDRTSAFKELFGLAVVGRKVDLETLVDLDKLLRIAKVSFSRIQFLGGPSVLISFLDCDSANKFLDSRVIWGPWFTKLEAWRGQSLPLERVAWLKLHGIPLHLVDEGVLTQVGELFGKVLHVPKSFDDDLDLSLVTVGVLAGEAVRIGEVVTLGWKGRSFRIWVEEEREAWVPDCLGPVSGASPETGSDSPLMSFPVGNVEVEGPHIFGGKGKWRSRLAWTLGLPMRILGQSRMKEKKVVEGCQWKD
ncbi:putative RNA recognition motif domain, nucleotide-binding alpha-beta plait domain superfamily [Helianthus annuus]|nr:putative RNA recognition motif domain, nucleotide-binding alpha-beta plait domain superfamily [Helianthus annuus]KAJ0541736.1 putative RNA recognition motif domain, nucleotide-binding alpha-beta plait domain superfamily [Helianthus annuus]KAJ0706811.1 putative RNA recognition motif domain, nucleotide-binding alpha-beta plait domain superfamily [Helianthus annuus]KAJ0887416.1 putative RNA recognition motif domain, nucleotide-binding alpha-beta plait domain superfamily [Helianthus annuus]